MTSYNHTESEQEVKAMNEIAKFNTEILFLKSDIFK